MGRSTQSAKRIVSGGVGTRRRPPPDVLAALRASTSPQGGGKTIVALEIGVTRHDQAELLPAPAAASEPGGIPALLARRPCAAGAEKSRAAAHPALCPNPRRHDGVE